MPSYDFVHDLSDNLKAKKIPHVLIAIHKGKLAANANTFSDYINEENFHVLLAGIQEIYNVLEADTDPHDVPGKNFELCEVIRNQGIEYLILTLKKNKDEYSVRWYCHLKDENSVMIMKNVISELIQQVKKFSRKRRKKD